MTDEYRSIDRKVKSLVKMADRESSIKQRKKRAWNEAQGIPAIKTLESECYHWSQIVDVRNYDPSTSSFQLRELSTHSHCSSSSSSHHLCTCSDTPCKVYHLENYPAGLYIISRALCKAEQYRWSKIALEEYTKEEHTNLSNLASITEEKQDSKLIWEESCQDQDNFLRFRKLRWSCLGYHYDWTRRSYQKDLLSVFPDDFANQCRNIAQLIGNDLRPEAAIVNYYPTGSCMGGHIDDAEHDLNRPIVSISLGRSAIFLIGGQTKDIAPTPILVRSGDAVVMTGESRLCYHGIAAILTEETEEYLTSQPPDIITSDHIADSLLETDENVLKYLRGNRINMNVRQVKIGDGHGDWQDKTGSGYQGY